MTSHNEDKRAFAEPADEESWEGTNTDMKIRPSHNEAQKTNEESKVTRNPFNALFVEQALDAGFTDAQVNFLVRNFEFKIEDYD